MARRRHRVDSSPRASGYIATASPTRPPTSHIYLDKNGRLYTEGFVQDEYAAAFIRAALEGEGEYKWRKNEVGRLEVHCDSGLRLRASTTEELERLFEIEDEVELPIMHMRQLAAFKEGHGVRAQRSDGTEIEPKEKQERKKREPRGEREPKVKKEKPAGYKGVPELCEATGKEGGDVRAALRKLYTKPDIGWLWPDAEFDKVLAAVKKAVK